MKDNEQRINSRHLATLKAKYGPDVINYFYETVFHEDNSDKKLDHIAKWQADLRIVVLGSPTAVELDHVAQAVSRVNGLNLPVRCSIGNTSDSGSVDIFFGDAGSVAAYLHLDSISDPIDTTTHFGMVQRIDYDGVVSKARIGICYSPNDTIQSLRAKIVQEEIIQSLGITGDSYTYPQSLFFENYNPEKHFTKLDEKVLSLLYEPVIPAGYSRVLFEDDFADVLYAINTSQKAARLLKQYPEELFADSIIEDCFTAGILLKHPRQTNLYLYGPVQKEDSTVIKNTIALINKISQNIKVNLSQPPSIEPEYGIMLTLRELKAGEDALQCSLDIIKGSHCMFPKLIKTKFTVAFSPNGSSRKQLQQVLAEAVYLSLVPVPQRYLTSWKLFTGKEGGIHLEKRYQGLLALIYSNEFVDGFGLSDFKQIKSGARTPNH